MGGKKVVEEGVAKKKKREGMSGTKKDPHWGLIMYREVRRQNGVQRGPSLERFFTVVPRRSVEVELVRLSATRFGYLTVSKH